MLELTGMLKASLLVSRKRLMQLKMQQEGSMKDLPQHHP